MADRLALIGGEEFSDDFEEIHAGLVAALGGKPRVVFLPTPRQMTESKRSNTGALQHFRKRLEPV